MGFFQNGLDSVKGLSANAKVKGTGFKRVAWALFLVALVGGGWYYFSSKGEPDNDKRAGSKNRPVSVVVGEVKRGDITVSLNALGTVVPRNSVTVYPQVSGVLVNVYFKEGEMVQAGQVLAQIDPRSYEASLKQASGALERDKNLLRNAELDLKRYETLIAQESISTQVYDTQRALTDQYRGNVLADQGLVDAAKLQVEYARITAPIGGRIGLRQVDPGNLIQANNSTPLFVITQVSPTTAIFAVPQSLLSTYLQKLNPSMGVANGATNGSSNGGSKGGSNRDSNFNESAKAGGGAWSGSPNAASQRPSNGFANGPANGSSNGPPNGPPNGSQNASKSNPPGAKSGPPKPVEIEAWDSDSKSILDKGRLESIDNVIDLTTGTVKLRAIFPNTKGTLFANQFVNVKSILEVKQDVIYMPATAMQKGTIGTFVYRVNEDGKTVSVVPVKLGPTDEDKILVESGLNPGDKVVVDGLDKLREGANIVIGEAARPGGARGKRPGDSAEKGGDKGSDKGGDKGTDKGTDRGQGKPDDKAPPGAGNSTQSAPAPAPGNSPTNAAASNAPNSTPTPATLSTGTNPGNADGARKNDKSEKWDKSKANKEAP
jgi:multidrug efflux system membrane fusion protein